MYISKDQKNKLEMNLKKYLMVSYSEGNKVYRLFDVIAKKCYIHRNIIFNEKPLRKK